MLTFRPRELVFEFSRVRDRARWRCELHHHRRYGTEARLYLNDQPLVSRTFTRELDRQTTPDALALRWALLVRDSLMDGL